MGKLINKQDTIDKIKKRNSYKLFRCRNGRGCGTC